MRRILLISVPVLLAAIIAFVVVSRPPGSVGNLVTNTPGSGFTNMSTNVGLPVGQPAQVEISAVSRNFSERYATTSTLAPVANLEAALPYASAGLQAAFRRSIAAAPAPGSESVVTTSRAMALSLAALDERGGRATMNVTLQRTEVKTDRSRTYIQDLNLQLVREGDDWKVNVAVLLPPE